MGETFNKKEKEKKRQQKKKEKEERKAERKANAKAGQSWENMVAYVDENGNISNTPPDPMKKHTVNQNDIVIGSRNMEGVDTNPIRKGRVISFNHEKGYGFIKDVKTQESVFVHINAVKTPIKENDTVTFMVEHTVKGLSAIGVSKI